MGKLITFEGIEGCGKSTQVRKIKDTLISRQIAVAATEEPGGSGIGKTIRSVLLNKTAVAISAEAELFLFMADRVQHIRDVISPALNQDRIVLCDRFTDATIAYQGCGRGLDIEMIEVLNRYACGDVRPDLTFLFDLPVETGLERALDRISRKKASEREDRFESEAIDFHQRVREGYLSIARREPHRFRIINGLKGIEDIHAEIWGELAPLVNVKRHVI